MDEHERVMAFLKSRVSFERFVPVGVADTPLESWPVAATTEIENYAKRFAKSVVGKFNDSRLIFLLERCERRARQARG